MKTMLRFESIIGAVLAFYFLVGRWSPGRLTTGADESDFFLQPRVWAVLGLLLLVTLRLLHCALRALPGARHAKTEHAGVGPVVVCGLLLQVYLAATVLWAPWQASESLKFGEVLLLIGVQVCLLLALPMSNVFQIRNAFWGTLLVVTGMLAILGAFAQATGRAAALGGGPNVFGRNMGLMMLGSLYLLDHRWQGRRRGFLACGIAMAAGGLLVIMSGSRGAMVSVTVAFLVLFLLRRTISLRRAAPWIMVPTLACGAFLFTEFGRGAAEMFRERIVIATFQDRYTSDRDALFRCAIETGIEHPVLGIGLDGFRTARWDEYPHNFFLEVFAEGGGVGLLLACAMMWCTAAAQLRLRGRFDTPTITAFVLVLAATQFSGDLYDSRGIFLFAALSLAPRVQASDISNWASAARCQLLPSRQTWITAKASP